jgi:hypothetical protein
LNSSVNGGMTTAVTEIFMLIELIVQILIELQNKENYAVYRYHDSKSK